jgi:hypothetical protein
METDFTSSGRALTALETELELDGGLPDEPELGLTSVELALAADWPAVFVAVEEKL